TLLLEHFLEPEETTSDDGVHTIRPGSTAQPGAGATIVATRVLTTPLSQDRNVYQEGWRGDAGSEIDIGFALRVFPGAWGLGPAHSWSKAALFTIILAEQVFGG